MHRDTRIQHHGEDRERSLGSVGPPIYRTSLFTFPDCASFEKAFRGGRERHLYSRVSNPTVRVLEEKLADLEGAEDAIALASGMGAISAVLLAFLGSGDHLVLLSKAYAPTLSLARGLLRRMGVEVTFLPPEEVGDLERHLRPRTRLIYVESPASITFEVIDLEAVARVGRAKGIPTISDNSWASPIFLQPARLGIDMAVHSGTKYIGGHSDILLGVAAGRRDLLERVRSTAILLGASLSPEDAFLAVRGLRTLPLRMQRHGESAFLLARQLLVHDRVAEVLHPALPFFPGHALWKRQFSGSSGLFSFRLRGDVRRFADALGIFRLGVSWGGFESLVLPSALVAAGCAADDPRPDIPPDLIRLSVGLEDPGDLWADLERGFAAL
ncbi:MAG: PLP-dependent transferase [Planctomycetes bacterium]|nr:PLP-dependent transferase [Planctomycetota bacterium]